MEQNCWYSELLCKVGLLPPGIGATLPSKNGSWRDLWAKEVFNSHSCWAVLLRCQPLLRKRAWKLTWQVPAARCLTPGEQLRKCEISPRRCCNCNFGSIFCFLGSKSWLNTMGKIRSSSSSTTNFCVLLDQIKNQTKWDSFKKHCSLLVFFLLRTWQMIV